ncbi:MAG: ABC transporter permease subunit, partial [Candidatus Rokuibacteriota bacterium]
MEGRRRWAWLGLALVVLSLAPALVSTYDLALLLALLSYVALASAWALFSGPTRYLSFATAAFYGVGAYTVFLATARLAWPLPVVAGAALAALLALGVGGLSLRLRGPYFAVLTFGLSELIRHVVLSYELRVTGTVGRILTVPFSLS